MLVAGIMSGTSVDGIDVALVEIEGEGLSISIDVVGFEAIEFPDGVREEVLEVTHSANSCGRISQLNFLLGRVFADALETACEQVGVPLERLELVGSHGQTIYHQAEPDAVRGFPVSSTMQVGEPACIARVARAPVVSGFRAADVVAGGHGAPLVPFADYLLFRHAEVNRVALNIGGIANLTAIPANAGSDQLIAFDTGPGNMVSDHLVETFTGGEDRFDRDGRMAARGEPDEELLSELLADPYYRAPAPKSTGRERYGTEFSAHLLKRGLPPEVLVATAAQLTVQTIVLGIDRVVRPIMEVDELIVSGGGWHNPAIIEPLRERLPRTWIRSTEDFGIGCDAKEAVAFAILAYETFHHRPANLPSATGADRPVILGSITHAHP